jgi:hypothetical protein
MNTRVAALAARIDAAESGLRAPVTTTDTTAGPAPAATATQEPPPQTEPAPDPEPPTAPAVEEPPAEEKPATLLVLEGTMVEEITAVAEIEAEPTVVKISVDDATRRLDAVAVETNDESSHVKPEEEPPRERPFQIGPISGTSRPLKRKGSGVGEATDAKSETTSPPEKEARPILNLAHSADPPARTTTVAPPAVARRTVIRPEGKTLRPDIAPAPAGMTRKDPPTAPVTSKRDPVVAPNPASSPARERPKVEVVDYPRAEKAPAATAPPAQPVAEAPKEGFWQRVRKGIGGE